ncbi:MAG: hydrogenase maturation protease [Lewinella sp.]|nr:hydrogenase maturation protease [Lewinella sp.]
METIHPQHPILLMGVGSLLMGDEGVGVHFARHVARDGRFTSQLDVVDGGTGGFYLWEYFEKYPTVILIDATLDERPPGSVRRLRPRFASDFPRSMSTHDIGLRDVVESLQLMGRMPELHLLAVSIEDLQLMQDELTPPVAASFPALEEHLREILHDIKVASKGEGQ